MKKLLSLCALALLIMGQPGFAQKKKTPVKKKTTYKKAVPVKKRVENTIQYDALAAYIKVWGFARHNHPALASGKLNADSVFLSNLYTVERVVNKTQFSQAMLKMLATLGEVPAANTAAGYSLKNDNWVATSTMLSDELRGQLLYIEKNRYAEVQARSAKVSRELEKVLFFEEDVEYPNMPYQMLSLARYWNNVQYSASNNGLGWDSVLTHFVPGFYKARTEADVESLMRNVIDASSADQGSNFSSQHPDGHYRSIAFFCGEALTDKQRRMSRPV